MAIRLIDPLDTPGWDQSLLDTGDWAFFHTAAWASVLVETYGYKPVYFVSFEHDKLTAVVPTMQVTSILTGKRAVALPFSDWCQPHYSTPDQLEKVKREALRYGKYAAWKYIEWRHSAFATQESVPWRIYVTHDIDLKRSEKDLLGALGPSRQRNIKKAIREGVSVEFSTSTDCLQIFYRLHCLTRKRHGVPPQPFAFFKNIARLILATGYGIIVAAWYHHRMIAASIFFHFGENVIFKYGASDRSYQELRANDLVMWEAIRWYRDRGYSKLNLGRTDPLNLGLIRFKRDWGADERPLPYFRCDVPTGQFKRQVFSNNRAIQRFLSLLPISFLRALGSFAYRHLG